MINLRKILYGEVLVGATNTILGIYKILGALKVLRQWADEVYRNWLDGIMVSTRC